MYRLSDAAKYLMCSEGFNMDAVSDTTHIKTIFSFSSDIGKNFIGNALNSSDDPVTHLIHILQFFTIFIVFYKLPEEKIQRSQIQRTRRPGNGSPSSSPTIRKLAAPKHTNTTGEVMWCSM
jgi:hypothetical protein